MRRIVITGIVLIGVVILSSLAATRTPETSVVVAAPSQNPQPVTVTNFPAPQVVSGTVNVGNLPAFQNVTVGNLPAVQQVGGSVAVTNLPGIQSVTGNVAISNLPAVQNVSGTVAVGNLPLDAAGNLRTTPAVPAAPFLIIKIADGLAIDAFRDTRIPLGTFNVGGYHRFLLMARATISHLDTIWCLRVVPVVTFDGSRFGELGSANFCSSDATYTGVSSAGADSNQWPELTVEAIPVSPTQQGVGTATLDAWLYLSN